LAEVGLEPERLEMFNMGASDATKFTAAVKEMTKRAKELGPNPLRKGEVVQKEARS
jgi:F420-non-reducing hydrogenase iron-sulfur subunit